MQRPFLSGIYITFQVHSSLKTFSIAACRTVFPSNLINDTIISSSTKIIVLSFHRSFEEYFAAPASQDPVMTARGFVRAHKAEFGRWSRCRRGAGWRRADIWSHPRAKEGRGQGYDVTVMSVKEVSKSTSLTFSLPSEHVSH